MSGDIRATLAELNAVSPSQFPSSDSWPVVTHLGGDTLRIRWRVDSTLLRPGNTISAPTTMTPADIVAYMSVLAARSTDCQAVTASLTIHFLRRSRAAALEAVGTVRLGGRRSWSVAVHIYSADPISRSRTRWSVTRSFQPESRLKSHQLHSDKRACQPAIRSVRDPS